VPFGSGKSRSLHFTGPQIEDPQCKSDQSNFV
jgi:hypothetical protein